MRLALAWIYGVQGYFRFSSNKRSEKHSKCCTVFAERLTLQSTVVAKYMYVKIRALYRYSHSWVLV